MQELHVKSLLPVRLDKYLMEQFPALGLGRLNKALRENKIKLNGKKQPLATRVQNGDVIRVYLLDDQLGLTSQEGPEFLQARAPAEFIYENDDLIVANKPAGIPVDGDESDTLLNRVLRGLPRTAHRGLLAVLAVPTMILIAFYILGFAVSWGPIAWVLIGEIFPLSVRGIGSSFGSAANWLGNFIVSQFFLVLLDAFGNNVGGPFAIFGVFSALSIPFVMRLVPETNGKSLEEIEEEMTKR